MGRHRVFHFALAKPRPGVPSGVYGVNIEEKTGPEDPEFRNRVEGLTHFLTSRSFEFRGKPDDSLKHLEAAAKADPRRRPSLPRPPAGFSNGKKTDKAIEILRLAQAANPESVTTHEWLGLAYQQASQPDEAIAAFGSALAKSNPTLISVRGPAKLHAAAKRFDDAFKVLDTAFTKDKREPEFWLGIADLYRDTGIAARSKMDRIKAGIIASLDKASALKPESPLILHRLADYYKVWGESDKAIALFIQLIELNPGLIGVREQLADLYLRADMTQDATRQLEAILRERPTNERALFVLGGIKRQLDKLEEAAAHFETVLKINPKFELAYYELAGVRLFQNRPTITLATLKRPVSSSSPGSSPSSTPDSPTAPSTNIPRPSKTCSTPRNWPKPASKTGSPIFSISSLAQPTSETASTKPPTRPSTKPSRCLPNTTTP